jgi:squalene synthase HpnC
VEQGATPSRADRLTRPVDLPSTAVVLAKASGENFSVASRLLPSTVRPHLLAVYGFARLADDIGDEAGGDRLALLDWLERELDLAEAGRAEHPLLRRLGTTIRSCSLPLEPFRKLIDANRQDQVIDHYATFEDLVAYCRLSANPVGELVLRIFGAATPDRLRWSDDVCTGLQLVEHLQDVGEDARSGRVYVPTEDLARFGCSERSLLAPSAGPLLRAVVLFETDRAEALLASGVPLAASLRGRTRLGVAAFAAGGLAVLDAIRAADGDTLGTDCHPRRHRVFWRWLAVLRAASTRRD